MTAAKRPTRANGNPSSSAAPRRRPASAKPLDGQADIRRDSKGHFLPGNKEGPRFKPGQSGNPKGRTPSHLLSDMLREKFAEPCPDDEHGRTWGEVVVERTLELARDGNVPAIKEVFDRLEGRVTQHVAVDTTTDKGNRKDVAELEARLEADPEANKLLNALRERRFAVENSGKN